MIRIALLEGSDFCLLAKISTTMSLLNLLAPESSVGDLFHTCNPVTTSCATALSAYAKWRIWKTTGVRHLAYAHVRAVERNIRHLADVLAPGPLYIYYRRQN